MHRDAASSARLHLDCATWLHKARALPIIGSGREKELTGREAEPWDVPQKPWLGKLVIRFEHIISTTDIVPGDIPVHRVALDRIRYAGDIECETRTVSEGDANA